MKTDKDSRVKFSLRIPEKLKQEIKIQSAKDDAHSMNEWIIKTLQDALSGGK
jgi:predicted HicB family RNase H-like nuclease